MRWEPNHRSSTASHLEAVACPVPEESHPWMTGSRSRHRRAPACTRQPGRSLGARFGSPRAVHGWLAHVRRPLPKNPPDPLTGVGFSGRRAAIPPLRARSHDRAAPARPARDRRTEFIPFPARSRRTGFLRLRRAMAARTEGIAREGKREGIPFSTAPAWGSNGMNSVLRSVRRGRPSLPGLGAETWKNRPSEGVGGGCIRIRPGRTQSIREPR